MAHRLLSCSSIGMHLRDEFIRAEIRTGYMMIELAYTELGLGALDAAYVAIRNARTALASAKRFLPLATPRAKSSDELTKGIEILRRAVEQYESNLEVQTPQYLPL